MFFNEFGGWGTSTWALSWDTSGSPWLGVWFLALVLNSQGMEKCFQIPRQLCILWGFSKRKRTGLAGCGRRGSQCLGESADFWGVSREHLPERGLQTANHLLPSEGLSWGWGVGDAPSLPTSDSRRPSPLSAEWQSWTQTSLSLPRSLQASTPSSEASGRSGLPVPGSKG